MQVLDLSDGYTLARVRGARKCWAGPGTPLVGAVVHGVVVVDNGNWTVVVRRTTPGWARLAMAVSSTTALISTVWDQDGRPARDVLCRDLS